MLYIRAYDENVRTKRRHPSKEGSPTMMMSTLFPAMLYSFFEQMFVLSPLAVSPVVVVVVSSSSSSGEKRSALVFIASPLSSSCSSPAPRRRPSLLSFVSISRRRNLRSRLCARPRRPRRQKRRRSPTRGRRRSSVLPFRLRNALLDVACRRPLSSVEIYLCTNALKFLFLSKEGNLEEKKVPQKTS